MSSTKNEILITVFPSPSLNDDNVVVFLPPILWGNEALAEAIKKAVEMTFAEKKVVTNEV